MRRTNLHGHALRSEGKPYEPGETSPWLRVYGSRTGVALCECGAVSPVLESDAARKRWHRDVRKAAARGAFDGAPGHG
jgi:hypothetical protein